MEMETIRVVSISLGEAMILLCTKCGPMGVSPNRPTAKTEAHHHLDLHGVAVHREGNV